MRKEPCDYIAYIDESAIPAGDGVWLCYCACIFNKDEYVDLAVPASQRLKFKWFGHDMVVLRSYDIRNWKQPYDQIEQGKRPEFLQGIADLIEGMPVTVVACCGAYLKTQAQLWSGKKRLLQYAVERIHLHVRAQGKGNLGKIHIVLESSPDDQQLREWYDEVKGGKNYRELKLNSEIQFAPKKHNSTGMQIADLAAYPVLRHVMGAEKDSRAFKVVAKKLRRNPANGQYKGWGIKEDSPWV